MEIGLTHFTFKKTLNLPPAVGQVFLILAPRSLKNADAVEPKAFRKFFSDRENTYENKVTDRKNAPITIPSVWQWRIGRLPGRIIVMGIRGSLVRKAKN